MTRLLLVKHALPELEPDVPVKTWRLGEQGRAQGALLAEALRPYAPSVVITSDELKAAETGKIVSKALNVPCHTASGLHKHDRTGVPYFNDPAEFEKMVRAFFVKPGERVFGTESANAARQRFVRAVKEALEPHPEQDVVIVAHGTVNTLFVAAHHSVVPFDLWKAWELGGFAVLSRPDFALLEPPLPPG